jgi:hypothetical protein
VESTAATAMKTASAAVASATALSEGRVRRKKEESE